MNKLLVILGPNASGKSDLAIKIAKQFSGEIISADSRQVYKELNIGSGKVPIDKKTNGEYCSQGIRHYLLNVVDPKEYFSVAQYQKLARQAIESIQKSGKLPILCGGAGLYISAIIEGWQFPDVPPNQALRQSLSNLSKEALYHQLQTIDSQRALNIDKNNKRRLLRALEISLNQKKPITPLKKVLPPYDILILGIETEPEKLKIKIEKRLDERLNQGMIEEVKKLKEKGISSQRLEDFGLEYRWINRYLENKIGFSEMRKSLLQESWQYAKRQKTWFRKIKNIHWIREYNTAIELISNWLGKNQNPVF